MAVENRSRPVGAASAPPASGLPPTRLEEEGQISGLVLLSNHRRVCGRVHAPMVTRVWLTVQTASKCMCVTAPAAQM